MVLCGPCRGDGTTAFPTVMKWVTAVFVKPGHACGTWVHMSHEIWVGSAQRCYSGIFGWIHAAQQSIGAVSFANGRSAGKSAASCIPR